MLCFAWKAELVSHLHVNFSIFHSALHKHPVGILIGAAHNVCQDLSFWNIMWWRLEVTVPNMVFFGILPHPESGGWGWWAIENKSGYTSLISGKMQPLQPSAPAVLFPCSVLKLLKLTYYLLDWPNMFVFCVHVCVSAFSPPFSPYILIECCGVTAGECPINCLHWVSQRPFHVLATVNCMFFLFLVPFLLVMCKFNLCLDLVTNMWVSLYFQSLCVSCFSCRSECVWGAGRSLRRLLEL